MTVYRRFNRNDILFSSIHARPQVSVKFGVNGWDGTPGISGSLSLYAGIRARRDVRRSDFTTSGLSIYPLDNLDTHSIDKVVSISGSYPSTGSIRFVRVENTPAANFQSITDTHWYDEHFRPIELLYDFYSVKDPNYFLGSHDFYTPLMLVDHDDPDRSGPYFVFSGSFAGKPITASNRSFSAEAWVKLLPNGTSSISAINPTIMSQQGNWGVYVDENNRLGVKSYPPFLTASNLATITPGLWTHVAVLFSSSISASFYVNGVLKDTLRVPGGPLVGDSEALPLLIGSDVSGSAMELHCHGWNGFLGETRVWNRLLTTAEISANSSGTLINSSSANLCHYARYNDGPYGTAHGFAPGSGAFDYSPGAHHGYSAAWSSDHQIHWQPSDHPTFVPKLTRANLDNDDIRVIHVPSMFYGRQIDPGTVRISDGVYNKKRVVRVLNDDGRGTLYVSGSMTRDLTGEEYTGEQRRKVGDVFYSEGLIVITDPALHDMFDEGSAFWEPQVSVSGVFGDLFSLSFRGQTRIHTKTFNCRLGPAEANASNNLTFSRLDNRGTEETGDDRLEKLREDGVTYVTAVGLYNEDHQLIAVAKIAQPIRKREKDKTNIRLKMDF